jgi:predicted amidohydrolase
MKQTLKIAALQKRMNSPLPPYEIERLQGLGVDLICLPEYFFIPDSARKQTLTAAYRQSILAKLEATSSKLQGIVVGGTLVEKEGLSYYNTCHVFSEGKHIGAYRKVHPTSGERDNGISPGDGYKVFDIHGIRLGVLICADVLFPDSFAALAELQPDLIAIPTTSPFRQTDSATEKRRRDLEIYVAGAQKTSACILKTCGVGYLMGKRLQGRSLICTAEGIIAQVGYPKETLEATLVAEIEVESRSFPSSSLPS